MARVVVVGGGLGGCASAARLAKQGHEVTVVERRNRLGGALGYVERDGFRWDAGPSTTALPAVLRDLFRKSGRPLERELDLAPVEPMREHRFDDGTVLALPSGSRAAQLEAVDRALGPGRGREWVDYVHGHAETWDLLRRSVLERPWSPEHADPATRSLLLTRTSLGRAVRRSLRDPRLRAMALHPVRLEGSDPRDVPAWRGMWCYVEQAFGVWTVPGGLGALAGTMTKRLEERKVTLLLGTRARDLRLEGDTVVGVDTDAGTVDADVVVLAVDPRLLPVTAPFVEAREPALPPLVAHLGLTGDVPDLPHEMVLHADPTVVVRTAGTAPEGGHAWTVLGRAASVDDLLWTLKESGIDVRRQVRVRVERTPRDQVEALGQSAYGVRWRGRATTKELLRPLPLRHVYAAGVHAATAPDLALSGLTAAVVAERVGPAR